MMADKANGPAAKKPATRLVVRSAFAHEGVYYTTHNIGELPENVLKQKLKNGAVVEEVIAPDAIIEESK